ncbi:MAG: hypothetical protein ACQETH_13585 [Candidatus Rifleibacteriota bacterium]
MTNNSEKNICPFCQKPVPARDIHERDNFAFCSKCEDGFRIEDEWREKFNCDEAELSEKPPEGFFPMAGKKSFALIIKTRSLLGILILVFSLPFIIMPVSLLLYPQVSEGFSLVKTLFALPFILGGLIAIWTGLVKLVGVRKILVNTRGEGIFETRVGPLKSTQKFYWGDIDKVRVGWRRSSSANSSTVQVLPEVVLVDRTGRKKIRLATELSREQAQYICMFLNERLKAK